MIDIGTDSDEDQKDGDRDWKLWAERDNFSVSCLMLNSKNYFGTDICIKCHSKSDICSCNSSSSKKKSKSKTKKSKPNEYDHDSSNSETFPPLSSDISDKPDIKEMEVLSNLDNVRDLEFSHEFIAHQIDKFAITPIFCNNCNDLSKHLLDPAYYTRMSYTSKIASGFLTQIVN